MTWPKYPTALFGFVRGRLRLETCGGKDLYDENPANRILFFVFPLVLNVGTFAVTHLQKKSRFGFLVMWPFCFHVWFTFRYQQQKVSDGGVMVDVPGSECVFYWRFGLARWDAGDCKYISPTWYGPGLHWD